MSTALVPYTSPTLLPSKLPNALTEAFYTQTIKILGGEPPYSCALAAGTLPTGFQLDADTCTISGTPTVVGSYTFTIRGTANGVSGERTYTVAYDPIVITTESIPEAVGGSPYTTTFTASGGKPFDPWYSYDWYYMGVLPDGLRLDSTGKLSGTPTTGGTFHFDVHVRNFTDYVIDESPIVTVNTKSFTLSLMAIDTATLPVGVIDTSFSQTLAVSGGSAPDTGKSLPDHFLPESISTARAARSAAHQRQPVVPTVTVRVSDASGTMAIKTIHPLYQRPHSHNNLHHADCLIIYTL